MSKYISNIKLLKTVPLSYNVYSPPVKIPSKIPILATHGLLASKINLHNIAQDVAKLTNRTVITIDARNHGESPHASEFTYEAMAADVMELAKSLHFDRFSLLGHSMGGKTFLAVALQEPKLVEKLIMLDVSPISTPPSFKSITKGYFQAMLDTNFETGRKISLEEGKVIAEKAISNVLQSSKVRSILISNLLGELDGKIFWKLNIPVMINSINDIASFPIQLFEKTFEHPTLLIRGERSPYLPDKDIPTIKKTIPNSQVITLKNAGHWPHLENPKGLLDSIVPFLDS